MTDRPSIRLSVVICTFNPDAGRLAQTLDGLKHQTLAKSEWELILIDNNSDNMVPGMMDISWQPASRVVHERRQGLTYSRMRGFAEATAEIIVLVDDDNILAENYLEELLAIFVNHPALGAAGGRSAPLFSAPQPAWLREFYGNLALRDLGEDVLTDEWSGQYPSSAPIGAGMGIRKSAVSPYLAKLQKQQKPITDRTGYSLTSGGDNDLIMEVLKAGWFVGYFPSLSLTHIIPAERLTIPYLSRLAHDMNRSWIRVLADHGICPWKKIKPLTLPLRKLKAYFNHRAWRGEAYRIRWKGVCGMLEGLAELDSNG